MFRRIPPRPTRRTRFPARKKDEKDEYVNCLKPLINGRGQILAEAALPSAGALYTETVVTCVLYCGSARHGCCHRARLAQEWI